MGAAGDAESMTDTSSPIIQLQGAGVRFRLARHRVPSFKEYAIHWMRGSLAYTDLWALRDIDLELERGTSLGVVGRNGAGKSTLLKVVSRILKPTEGEARIRGTVAPILELGTGFDHELSGHENIFLNALLLGHRRREIEERVDQIIEFSGLGDFIYSPIRSYSSGMQARLGFSIASAWKPEVLILDEVFAVGDSEFQNRCEEKLAELKARGTSLLLVSHATSNILNQCDRCIWLEKGRIVADGSPDEVVERYLAAPVPAPRAAPDELSAQTEAQ